MIIEFRLGKKRNEDTEGVRNSEKMVESRAQPCEWYGNIVGCRIQRE